MTNYYGLDNRFLEFNWFRELAEDVNIRFLINSLAGEELAEYLEEKYESYFKENPHICSEEIAEDLGIFWFLLTTRERVRDYFDDINFYQLTEDHLAAFYDDADCDPLAIPHVYIQSEDPDGCYENIKQYFMERVIW